MRAFATNSSRVGWIWRREGLVVDDPARLAMRQLGDLGVVVAAILAQQLDMSAMSSASSSLPSRTWPLGGAISEHSDPALGEPFNWERLWSMQALKILLASISVHGHRTCLHARVDVIGDWNKGRRVWKGESCRWIQVN
jgi:hypothetical protein